MEKLSFEEARALILNNAPEPKYEPNSVLGALGQVSSEAVIAQINVPDWDASALDGFALKAGDIQKAGPENPVILKLAGRITAGQKAVKPVESGTAIRIMTGAPIPAGADCVVGFEDTSNISRLGGSKAQIGILRAVSRGSNIRRAGEQIPNGSLVLNKGQLIGPGEIGLLAALGLTEIKVIKRPSAAIIANGEELLRPGQQLVEAKIFCGNSSALAAQVSRCGGLPHIISIARDSLTALRRQIQRGLQFDIIITIGGSALGDRDLVKEVMAEMGKVVFTQLEMTPGKSTAFGLLRKEGENGQVQIPHFALSGSPTAAMLSFEALVRPAILKMQSLNPYPELVTGQAAQSFSNPGGKMRLAWVSLQAQKGLLIVRPAEGRGVLQSIAAANGIAVIPPGIQKVQAGDCIQMMLLDWFNQGRGCSEGVR